MTRFTPAQDEYLLKNSNKETFQVMADRWGMTRHQVRGRLLVLQQQIKRIARNKDKSHDQVPIKTGEYLNRRGDGKIEWITSVDPTIQTVDQLIERCNVDLTKWRVAHQEVNAWQGFFRNTNTKISNNQYVRTAQKVQMYQVKIRLELITAKDKSNEKLRSLLIADMNQYTPKYPAIKYHRDKAEDTVMFECSIFDPHFGKLAWAKETGQDWDLKHSREAYLSAGTHLFSKAKNFNIDKILIPIGNDMLHVNNSANTTAGGTPQDVDSRQQKAFLAAKRAAVDLIDMAQTIAPVEVIVVPGNHDRDAMFFLGDSIASWFRKCPQVTVNNDPTLRKYVEYGVNLLGFTHGSEESNKRLNHLMQVERRAQWARCKYFEWHVGHLHIKRKKETFMVDSDTVDTMEGGIIKRWLPSLCATDAWHAMVGYVGAPRGAEAYIWSKKDGYSGHIAYNYKL